jgi:hypothetical protein
MNGTTAMSSISDLPESYFKRYIRSTLYAAIGRPPAPNLLLRGQHAIRNFYLPAHIEEQFGWRLNAADILVHRDENRKIVGHGWYCVGKARGDDVKAALASANLGHTFLLTWGSDKRIYSKHHHGPAVDVLKTQFTCEFFVSWGAQPDWQGLNETMKLLTVAAELASST